MKSLIVLVLWMIVVGNVLLHVPAHAAQANFIRNPAYADGFAHWQPSAQWERIAVRGFFAARAGVTFASDAAEICTVTYRATENTVRVVVAFKANKPGSATKTGAGYGAFYVRWLDESGVRLFDDMHILTDNAPPRRWTMRAWSALYPKESGAAYLQVCARAVAYGDENFTLAVTDWSATQ